MPNIELIHGDCMDYMKGLEDNSFDLTVTSPPYDDLRDYGGGHIWNRNTWQIIIKELYRITKPGGVVVWIVADAVKNGSETLTSFHQAIWAKECGFNLNDTMIWNKQSAPFPDIVRYPQSFEYMFVFSKGRVNSFNPIHDRRNKHRGTKINGTNRQKDGSTKPLTGNGNITKDWGARFNVWDLWPCQSNTERNGHPAPFPIKLAYDHIITWSNKGDLIFDPFLGSGTTSIAAHMAGRKFVGIEIDEDYYKAACERFEKETAQIDLFG